MKLRIVDASPREIEISAETAAGELVSVHLRLRKGKVARTEEVREMVFADYDKAGRLLAIEFAEPESIGIESMAELSERLRVPQLRMIDVSRFPVSDRKAVPA